MNRHVLCMVDLCNTHALVHAYYEWFVYLARESYVDDIVVVVIHVYQKWCCVSNLCTVKPFAQNFVQLISGVISSGSAHNLQLKTCPKKLV